MDSSENTLTVRIVGSQADNGLVRLEEFTEFCKAVERVLKLTDECLSEKRQRLQFRVADLECGSAVVTVDARKPNRGRDNRTVVFSTVRDTCRRLQNGERPDSRLTPKALRAYRALGKPLARAAAAKSENKPSVHVDGIELTSAFLANIDQLSEVFIRSEGSVTGKLEKLNRHNSSEFVIFPPIGTQFVTCSFPERLLDVVCDAIKYRSTVTVYGKMHFAQSKAFPVRADVENIELHPPSDQLPNLSQLAGTLKQKRPDLDSVAAVRAIRDEQ